MDPDDGGNNIYATYFKSATLTVAFSTIYYFQTQTGQFSNTAQAGYSPDSLKTKDSTCIVAAPRKKKIYLTFDDGPNKGTQNVLTILRDRQVPATLFVIGEHVYGSRFQQEIFDSACANIRLEIANHSFTHGFENHFDKFYKYPDSVVHDFKRAADSLHLQSNIVRTPGRNIWRTYSIRASDLKKSAAAADSLYSNGFTAIGWDLEWNFDKDRLIQTSEEMLSEVDSAFSKKRTKTENHLVLLAHDQAYVRSDDSLSLTIFIDRLKLKDDMEFETISNYPR
jgi:peptidoglycan/xylan/chitin deacetylase (PgdA/CDA1 family)